MALIHSAFLTNGIEVFKSYTGIKKAVLTDGGMLT